MVDLLDEQRLVEQLRHVEQCPGATDRAQRGLGAAMGVVTVVAESLDTFIEATIFLWLFVKASYTVKTRV